MNQLQLNRLHAVRDSMVEILAGGAMLRREALLDALRKRRYFEANFTLGALQVLIWQAIGIFDETFYRDPGSRRIGLTRQALAARRTTGKMPVPPREEENGRLESLPHVRMGSTGCARVAEYMEAREG
jgi:hypothetical protein